ncbi:hypothetical protein HDU88_002520 [Geranomyces variabilis]|nr:hypothetical protein HDU88_002520 [Geranomyces variabilis]
MFYVFRSYHKTPGGYARLAVVVATLIILFVTALLLTTGVTYQSPWLSRTVKESDLLRSEQKKLEKINIDVTSSEPRPSSIPLPPHSTPTPLQPESEYVAICLSVKGQNRDLPEWLTHHYHHIGIRRFYIMDDGTVPPLSATPSWGIPSDAITFVYYTNETRRSWFQQLNAYNDCQKNYGHLHTWIAYIDADEYFEMTSSKETFTDFLKSFEPNESVGAVGINWQMHNSNGLLKRPASARKAFTSCIPDDPTLDNRHIKSIVKTKYYSNAENPHFIQLVPGKIAVGENNDRVPWAFRTPITRDRVSLHHYAVNSREQYEEKIQRGNGMGQPKNNEFWEHVEGLLGHKCDSMAQYNP